MSRSSAVQLSADREVAALEKHACPACGAQAEWNPTKQKLVCPFCGTESPYQIDRETGKVVELDLVDGAARAAGRGARLADRAPQRAVPELPRGDGVRPGARRPELRVLRLAGAGRLRRDQGADPAAGRAAVPDRREPRARRHPPLVAQQVVRAGTAGRARRSSTPSAASTFRTGPSTRRCTARGTPRPAITTTSRCRAATQGPDGHAAGAADPLGAGVRRRRSRLRRRAGAGDAGAAARSAAAGRAVPDAGDRAYDTAFLSGHVVEHYQVVLLDAAQQSQEQMHAKLEALCAQQVPGDTHRNLQIHPDYLRPHVQARARAGLAAVVQLRRARRFR